MVGSLFAKEGESPEPGSAVMAAARLHGSAHVHAVRYGYKGTKPYRDAYKQHVGRFLSAMRQFNKSDVSDVSDVSDEPRDAHGRWMGEMASRGIELYGTGGVTGLSRSQVIGKIRTTLDNVSGHSPDLPRAASYGSALASRVVSMVSGLPADISTPMHAHVANATGFVVRKVLQHPAWRRLATSSVLKFTKSLALEESDDLKGLVSKVMADCRLHPKVACDDAALARVAQGAYGHLCGRLCALKAAAAN